MELLKYHQDLKDADPTIDWEEDSHLWHIEAIIGHKGGRKVKLKVLWSDLTTTWEDMHAVFLHCPKLVVEYGLENNRLQNPGWHVVRSYTELGPTTTTQVFKSTTEKSGPVFKFGVQVPRDSKEAIKLDKRNGNTKWQDAINAELKGINEYGTFRVLGNDEEDGSDDSPPDIEAVWEAMKAEALLTADMV